MLPAFVLSPIEIGLIISQITVGLVTVIGAIFGGLKMLRELRYNTHLTRVGNDIKQDLLNQGKEIAALKKGNGSDDKP